ncbi:hypothetical protein Psi01_40930 [Planobispora siamensis]|uniref:ABC transporter domain-containing protein n=1 Tax=Planobispora siamensis TaxID=936338 RepID=A0A8J3SPS4_9ACTN|nr:hypothetical protein Psi01_40930 [Planobispora siamensis]
MTLAFETEGLVKRFGKTTALAGIDLAARRGAVLGVLGPNGAGKTTAVRVPATLLRPDGGRAAVGGLDVVRHAARVRRLIGLTGQYASVDEDLTGMENLVLIGQLLDLRRAEAGARARRLLADFGLAEAAGRPARTYSGGMRPISTTSPAAVTSSGPRSPISTPSRRVPARIPSLCHLRAGTAAPSVRKISIPSPVNHLGHSGCVRSDAPGATGMSASLRVVTRLLRSNRQIMDAP